MSPRRNLLQLFNARPIKIAIRLSVAAVILLSLTTVGFIEYSAQPGFCDNCHIMEPYYESWAQSSHNDVPCIKCHYAPGIRAEAMGKLQAANQVVRYLTGAYDVKPWAEIEDAACLRSGCHVGRKLEGEVSYRGVRFDHTEHLGELRRGKQLRCTSCHSQIVQGEHVAVTQSTCFLCHFKDQPAGRPIAGCVGCHPQPRRIVAQAGFVVDHEQYIEDLVSCISCHSNVVDGSGAADQARCFNCHNEPERLVRFDDVTLMHRVHIAERNVECMQCHTPIEHRVVALAETFELDCTGCHRGTHQAQREIYAGIGGHGSEANPSSMFLARVSCHGCHELPSDLPGHEEVRVAGEASCLSCHGVRYADILPRWQAEMRRRVALAETAVTGARESLASAPARSRTTADSLLRLAEGNVELVRVGRGVHNLGYADELLRAALDMVREAVRTGSLPYRITVDLGPPLGTNLCLTCHFGMDRTTVRFGSVAFDHETHVVSGGMACTDCHTPMDAHGETTLAGEASCDGCHHSTTEPVPCTRCHAGPTGAPDTVLVTVTGAFSHPVHREAGLPCAECHTPPTMRADRLDCDTCHENHHTPEVTCRSCHQEGVQARHQRATAHVSCTQCHGATVAGIGRWSRQVCTVCHTDRVEHNAPTPCETCHNVPAMR